MTAVAMASAETDVKNLDYRGLSQKDFRDLFARVVPYITSRYNVVVDEMDLGVQVTGDFDGTEIKLRRDMDDEMKLFILLHLLGHTVQFNTSAELRAIGLTRYGPGSINDQTLGTICGYERNSSRYGLSVLHEIGIEYLDQWVSDWSNGDLRYLLELYTTGAKYELTPEFLQVYKQQYIAYGTELLTPMPVPDFTPQKWESRFSF